MKSPDGLNVIQTPIDDVICRLPESVQEWVQANVVFFVPENWSVGSAVTHEFSEPTSRLRLVYLPPESHQWSRSMREATVAHQIALHWGAEHHPGDHATEWGFGEGIRELKSRGWLECHLN